MNALTFHKHTLQRNACLACLPAAIFAATMTASAAFALPSTRGDTAPPGEPPDPLGDLTAGVWPLAFESNVGQMDASVNYRLRAAGYTLFLTDEEAVFVLRHGRGNVARGSGGNVIRMSFTDGRGSQRVVGEGAVATRLNYYRGRVPSGWHAGVASLAQVRYSEVYSGIDALFHTGNGKVEYDFVVRPDADPSAIQLAFKGAQGLRLGADGELVLQTTAGSLIQGAPVAYQLQDGERRNVPVRYRLGEDQRVGFALGAYDPGRTLVIDPDVDYATYLGGDAAADIAFTVVVDANGYIYLAGSTYSDDFPAIDGTTFGGEIDAFVAKLDRTQTGTD